MTDLERRLRRPFGAVEPLSLEEIARRVPSAGALVAASDDDERRRTGPRRWSERALLSAAVACLAVLCVALVWTSSPGRGTATVPASTTTSVDPVAMAEAYMAMGWVNSGMGPLLPGVDRPPSMWLRFYDDDVIDPLHFDEEGKAPTFDAPGGELIGYTFEHLQFVPLSLVDDPSFDPVEAMRQLWGCAPEIDPGCAGADPAPLDVGSP